MSDEANSVSVNSVDRLTTQINPASSAPGAIPEIAPSVIEGAKNLSPESKAALIAQYERAGFKGAAAAFGQTGPKDISPPFLIDPANVSAGKVFPGTGSGITDKQATSAIHNLIANWTGDRGQLMNELGRLGLVALQPGQQPNVPSPPISPMDPPASATDYRLDWTGLDKLDIQADPQGIAEFDRELREAMHAAGFAAATGPDAMRNALETALSLSGKAPEQVKQHETDQLAILRNVVGAENYETTIHKAAQSFQLFPEDLRGRLKDFGATKSVRFLLELARATERREARAKK